YNLDAHVRSQHDRTRPYVCDHAGCGAGFARRHDLGRHRRSLHESGRGVGGGEARRKVGRKVGRKEKEEEEKEGVKKEKEARWDGEWGAVKTEGGERRYRCEWCGISFARSDALKRHRESEMKRLGVEEEKVDGENE
ncbi:hypothetical protein HK101_001022, partial [Irineochytrium annulatum]